MPAPTPTASRLSDRCTAYYASLPSFALSTARTVDAMPALGKPAKGVAWGERLQARAAA